MRHYAAEVIVSLQLEHESSPRGERVTQLLRWSTAAPAVVGDTVWIQPIAINRQVSHTCQPARETTPARKTERLRRAGSARRIPSCTATVYVRFVRAGSAFCQSSVRRTGPRHGGSGTGHSRSLLMLAVCLNRDIWQWHRRTTDPNGQGRLTTRSGRITGQLKAIPA
jgi:hypothetical protein